jgi:hypothetical protein
MAYLLLDCSATGARLPPEIDRHAKFLEAKR